MFDFAISRNQRQYPTKRLLASSIVSCLAHVLAFAILVENPQLLRVGMFYDFHGVPLIRRLYAPSTNDEQRSRIVTVLEPMKTPSAATLKKYLYNRDKDGEGSPPISVEWEDTREAAANKKAIPMPKVEESKSPEISLPANGMAPPGPESAQGPEESESNQSGEASSTAAATVPDDTSIGNAMKKDAMVLPPAKDSEVADNKIPSTLPDTKTPPTNQAAEKKNRNDVDNLSVFNNEKQAIDGEGSGFFDVPKGFPIGDYASLIVERIKGKWLIPSNLKNSEGHTTVVFFIDKSGQYTGARIVMSSGNNSLDLAALNAVIESSPFPPLPKGFPGDHIGAKFTFIYEPH